MTKLFLIVLFLMPHLISADEINKMATIDGERNGIKVESFDFEREELTDSTSIFISTNEITNIKCAIYDKNDMPIKVSEGIATPPLSKVLVLSQNAIITSVKCWEQGPQKKVKRIDNSVDMYYKMPTFLLDD
jgi:hypothetical protein|tara:strand:+ start:131 stop:526 length:396 start_codon:yes stop_codon:yes gene_type:complete